jgi:hypothetical protein
MPELGFHRPIPRRMEERKEGENREEREQGEINGGSHLIDSAARAELS